MQGCFRLQHNALERTWEVMLTVMVKPAADIES